MHRHIAALLVCTALIGSTGCLGGVRVYDEPHRDYHRWNDREEHAYRAWLADRHFEYREFNRLDRRDQDEYWRWRHDHHDRDRDRR